MQTRVGLSALTITLLASTAPAHWPRGPVVPWGYSWGWSSTVVVVPAPVVYVPVPRFPFVEEQPKDYSNGLDLEAMRAKATKAVESGEFIVIAPGGKGVAKPPKPIVPEEAKPAIAKPIETPFEKLNREAVEAFQKSELGRATDRFLALIELEPNRPKLHFQLAQVRSARGQYAEAIAAIRSGMVLAPDWPSTPFRLAEIYGPNSEAFVQDSKELKAALAAKPGDAGLKFLIGYEKWFSGDRDGARELFRQAANGVKDPAMIERFLNAK